MNAALINFESNTETTSPTTHNLFEERSVLLELAHTAMHPSLDAKNRALASRFLIRQLLERLRDPRAPFSQVKVYLDVFHKVSIMGLIKAEDLGHPLRQRDNFDEEFEVINYIRTRRNTREKEWTSYHSNEELLTNRLRWKVVEFLKYLS